jgi:hypothetical protein
MRQRALLRGLMLIAICVAVAAALSLAVTTGQAASLIASSHAPDSTMVERLSREADPIGFDQMQATANISATAWLAAGVLLSPIYFEINLPLIER